MGCGPAHLATLMICALTLNACGGRNGARDEIQTGSAVDILQRAERQMSLGAHNQAIEYYEALEVRYPFSEQNREGQLSLMYAYIKDGQPEAATESANKFIRENPRHAKVDYAYYIRGLAYFPPNVGPIDRLFRVDPNRRPQSNARLAFDNFALLLQKYPDSEWAGDARQRMIYLRNAMAEYEVNVARYYMTRRAYVAATNRAKRVVEEYQGTGSVNNALEIMIDAYNKLGLTELAHDTQRVLSENQ